jgi:hypothetical protein
MRTIRHITDDQFANKAYRLQRTLSYSPEHAERAVFRAGFISPRYEYMERQENAMRELRARCGRG